LSSFNVSFEKGANLIVDKNSKIKFGFRGYISRLSNIESYNGALLVIGDHIFVNKNCSFVVRFGLKIGDNCQFGPNVCIYDHNHDFKKLGLIKDQGNYGKPIVIGNNVWVGAGSFIGAGVVIGDNAVIGANTVVTKDVPANTVIYSVQNIELRPFIKC
jgi:acetyltransferase-like isoleucine patch superfamily enzyme